MNLKQAKQRIEELEREVRELKARPKPNYNYTTSSEDYDRMREVFEKWSRLS